MYYNVNVTLTNGGTIRYNVSDKDGLASIIDIHMKHDVKGWTATEVQHPPQETT